VMRPVLASALGLLVGGAAAADELVVAKSLERNQAPDFAYRFDRALTGRGSPWSDHQIIISTLAAARLAIIPHT
jgi:hypothetical protein